MMKLITKYGWDILLVVVIIILCFIANKMLYIVPNCINYFGVLGCILSFLGIIISYISLRNVVSIKNKVNIKVHNVELAKLLLKIISPLRNTMESIKKNKEFSYDLIQPTLERMYSLKEELKESNLNNKWNKDIPEINELTNKIITLVNGGNSDCEDIINTLTELVVKLEKLHTSLVKL